MRDTATIRILSSYRARPSTRAARAENISKRLLDITGSAIGLLLLAPFFALIALRIRRDSPGPVFFRGERVGRGGKTFRILKFRTMREDVYSYNGPKVTAQDDPRVTPFGRWLRDSKVNELPQLWNVLVGEMSLVGPRPEDPQIAKDWPAETAREILSVRPGVTSPASILYRDEESMLQSARLMDTYLGEILPSKLRLDQLYVRHHTFWGDLDIIFWTLMVLVPQSRSQDLPEASLFLGPFSRLMRRHVRWFVLDLGATLVAIALAGIFWRTLGPLHVGWAPALLLALAYAALFGAVNAVLHVNQIEWSRAAATDALDLLPGVIVSLVAALLVNNLLPAHWLGIVEAGETTLGITTTPWGTRALLPNGMLVVAAVLAFVGFLGARYRTRMITGLASRWVAMRGIDRQGLEKVLIIGGGDTGQFAAWILNNGKYAMTLQVVGMVDDDLYKQDSRIHGLHVLGRREDIPELVAKYDVGILVFAIHNISAQERQELIRICQHTPARLFFFPDIPAALQQITRHDENDHSPDFHQPGITPDKLEGWLVDLEQTMQAGDTPGALQQIKILRTLVQNETQEHPLQEQGG